jgi:hypothetical protein
MDVVFTYLPIRLKDVTEIYLKYSIENLNKQNIEPIIYSDKDYFNHTNLKYKWIQFDIDVRYKVDLLWSYPKLKILSIIDRPFIHLDNDLIVEDFNKLNNLIISESLNVCYKRKIDETQRVFFIDLFKKYTNNYLSFDELNNTSIIATEKYELINQSYKEVLDVIDTHYDFFLKRYNSIPPITLNQQYPNLYFHNINYLFNENPSCNFLSLNGVCHSADKKIMNSLVDKTNLI